MDNRVDSILKNHFESQNRDKLLLLVTPNVGIIVLLSVIFTALVCVLLLIDCVVTNYQRYVGGRGRKQRVRHGRGSTGRGRRNPKPNCRSSSAPRGSLRRALYDPRRVPKGGNFSLHPSFRPIESSRPVEQIPTCFQTNYNEGTITSCSSEHPHGVEAEPLQEQYESWHTIWDSRETIG